MASTNGNKQNNRQNNNQAQRGYSVGENIHHQNVAAGNQGFQSGKNYTGNLGSFMQKANAPKNNYRAESITQQKGGYTGSSVSPADMASAAGQFASSDKMKDKWRGRGGKFEALKSDPSIVNTMNQAKANLANWNATKGKQLGYPAGMNTIAGVKPLTNLMLDRNLNVAAGVNPTTGMGFMDSIKSNAYVDRPLPSAGKGIMGLLSGLAGVPGMALGMLPNLFKNLSTDIGNTYNAFGNMVRAPSITSGLAGLYDDFTQGLKAESVPLMQGVNNPFGNMFNTTPAMLTSGAGTGSAIAGMNRWGMPSEFDTDQGLWTGAYKSGAVAPEEVTQVSRQPVFTGTPQQYSIDPFMNPHQLDGNYNLYDATRENIELANQGQTRFNYDMDGNGVVDERDMGMSDQVLNQNNILGTVIDSESALGDLYGKTLMSDGFVPMSYRYADPDAGQTQTQFVAPYMGAEPAVDHSLVGTRPTLQNIPGDALNYDAGNQGLDMNNVNLGATQNLGSFSPYLQMADASRSDINTVNMFPGMDRATIESLGGQFSPEFTDQDFKGIREGTITSPTGIYSAQV